MRLDPSVDTSGLWERYRASADVAARDLLLEQYVSLVHFVARRMTGRLVSVEYDELVSAGNVGLLKALDGYDTHRGHAFSTYAVPRIRGAILDDLRRRDWMPRSGRARSRRMLAARTELENRLQRAPTPAEMAGELGLELEAYWRWRDELDPLARPDVVAARGDAGDDSRVSVSYDAGAESAELPDQRLLREERLTRLQGAIGRLPEREARVLALSYFEELTMREVGVALGVTESRVCQLRQQALGRLRHALGPDNRN
jgi:RNA polymerase sigma factor for flagellar operon FliA